MLFTDGSVNTKCRTGFGAYLAVSEAEISSKVFRNQVKIRKFENTSSTKLELQTLLWALSEIQVGDRKVIVHTDSQNIISLEKRRSRLEKNNYQSKNNKRLNNFKIYQEFFKKIDKMDCEFFKVCGHLVSIQKNEVDHLFTLVDRASRKAVKGENR